MITREQERELVLRAKGGDREALDALLEAHKGYFYKLAKRAARTEADVEDYVQEARIGAMLALDKFDPDTGNRFMTYAGLASSRYVADAVCTGTVIATSRGAFNANASENLRDKARRAQSAVSLNVTVSDGDQHLASSLADATVAPDIIAADAEETERLREAVSLLPERLRELMRLRMNGATLREAGKALGVSRARAHQLEAKAHDFLRRSLESRDLFSVKPSGSRWSPAEIAYVGKHFFEGRLTDLASKINRPYGSLIVVARALKLWKPRFAWTSERDDFLRANQGDGWARCAAVLGCTTTAVYNRVRRLGIQYRILTPSEHARLKELHAAGLGNTDIAERLGVSSECVRQTLLRFDTKANGRNEARRMANLRETLKRRYGTESPTEVRQRIFAQRAAELRWPSLPYPSALVMAAFARLRTATVYDLPEVCRAIQAERRWHVGYSRQTARVTVKKLVDGGSLEKVSGAGSARHTYRIRGAAC
jgi:RNA polymerase sigma-32 factor